MVFIGIKKAAVSDSSNYSDKKIILLASLLTSAAHQSGSADSIHSQLILNSYNGVLAIRPRNQSKEDQDLQMAIQIVQPGKQHK